MIIPRKKGKEAQKPAMAGTKGGVRRVIRAEKLIEQQIVFIPHEDVKNCTIFFERIRFRSEKTGKTRKLSAGFP
jgi:hypothetical protein